MKNEEEIQNAIELYADMIQKICVLHMRQRVDAEDVFQTVFLKCMRSELFRDREHKKAWPLKVAMNACRERFRGWFHKYTDLQTEVKACADLSEISYFLLNTLNQLPPYYRNILYLFYYEGYKVREISGTRGRNKSTIRTWLGRGRETLHEKLGGELDGSW